MSEIVGQGISRENLDGAFNIFIDRISNDEKLRGGNRRRPGRCPGNLGLHRRGDGLNPLLPRLGLAQRQLADSSSWLVAPTLHCRLRLFLLGQ